MHVAFDASVVQTRLKGAGRVLVNLAAAMPRVDPSRRYSTLAFPNGAEVLRDAGMETEIVEVSAMSGLSWEMYGLANAASALGADVVFTLREIVSGGGPPTVLHLAEAPAYRLRSDLRLRPAKHIAKDVLLQALLRRSIRHAAVVTAASEATASWLGRRYGIDPPVIPPGIDLFFLEVGARSDAEPYLLHPATGDRRENTDLVLRAYAASTPPAALVLVGTPVQEQEPIAVRARALGIAPNDIRIHGWVSDEELLALYRGAVALVHPARFEGFAGLQPLEAMAQGTPVIALEAPGVTEALSDVAILVAEDPVALGAAMRQLATDEHACAEWGDRGRAFARAFTWERAAGSFVQVFDELARA